MLSLLGPLGLCLDLIEAVRSPSYSLRARLPPVSTRIWPRCTRFWHLDAEPRQFQQFHMRILVIRTGLRGLRSGRGTGAWAKEGMTVFTCLGNVCTCSHMFTRSALQDVIKYGGPPSPRFLTCVCGTTFGKGWFSPFNPAAETALFTLIRCSES